MIYDLLAPFYDSFNSTVDYPSYARFFAKAADLYMKERPSLVLDLGCGTGRMTIELAKLGFDMTGIDYSPEMLDRARESALNAGFDNILWLCQDMTEFELYGTVDAAICALDGINHLTKPSDLERCLGLLHNYLIPDGLLVFDLNSEWKFRNIYGERAYLFEEQGVFCAWQNYYNEKSRLCDFYITLFQEKGDGSYLRFEEIQRERMYTLRQIKSKLISAGFEFIGAYSSFDFDSVSDTDERFYIVAKCKK